MTDFQNVTWEERQRLRIGWVLAENGPARAYRILLEKNADEIAALKPEYLVERSETGEAKSVRALHLERFQAAKEAEAREQERIRKMVLEALNVEPKAQTVVAEKEQQWRKDLTPEVLDRLMRKMKKARVMDAVLAVVNEPYIMPWPLEASVYELDMAETCPMCGGVKHKGSGVCNRCFYRGRARPGGRL